MNTRAHITKNTPRVLTANRSRSRPAVAFSSEGFAKAWLNTDLSIVEIAAQFGGVSVRTLAHWANELGLPTARSTLGCRNLSRKAGHYFKKEKVMLSLLRNPEKRDTDIARELSCTREYVGQIRVWLNANRIVLDTSPLKTTSTP